MEKMKIEIWSDIACPYCYIGKKKFDQVLAQFENKDKIEVIWRSYELNPELPKSPLNESYQSFIAKGLGKDDDAIKRSIEKIQEAGSEVGIDFRFDKLVITSTSDALRLVKIAKQYNKADDAEELLFKAYFTEGKCISDREVLINIAKELNIPQDIVNTTLDSDLYLQEIKDDISYSETQLKLDYIPFYVFNQKNIIQGVIDPKTYLDLLTESFNDWQSNGIGLNDGDIISGQACSIDGVCS